MESLSIILPCYNEGRKIIPNILKIEHFLISSFDNPEFEIIIINDGSSDKTLNILEDYCSTDSHCCLISYSENKGKGHAVKKGIQASKNDIVIFMDADLSTDLSAIIDVNDYIVDYDAVIGSRRHPQAILATPQRLPRRFVGKTCSYITNLLIPIGISDTQCGFKAFKGSTIRDLISKQSVDGFSFDVELLYIYKMNGLTIKEIPVIWENDEDSKVTVINSSIIFFKDLIKIKFQKNMYKKK